MPVSDDNPWELLFAVIHQVQAPWAKCANCLGMDASLFYVEDERKRTELSEALDVCWGRGTWKGLGVCPARESCLEYGVRNNEVGVWGGYSGNDRKRLYKYIRRGGEDLG